MDDDCAGCRHLDESAGPDGALWCAHPIHHAGIRDVHRPPCEGAGFEPRFPQFSKDTQEIR